MKIRKIIARFEDCSLEQACEEFYQNYEFDGDPIIEDDVRCFWDKCQGTEEEFQNLYKIIIDSYDDKFNAFKEDELDDIDDDLSYIINDIRYNHKWLTDKDLSNILSRFIR